MSFAKLQGVSSTGGQNIVTTGISSTTKSLVTYPSCTITVFNAGTATPSTIYSDSIGTPKANPFTAGSDAYWSFYATEGASYDVRFSGTGIAVPFTLGDFKLPIQSIATQIQESGGPTTLTFGAIADGQVFKRSGTSVIGANLAFKGSFTKAGLPGTGVAGDTAYVTDDIRGYWYFTGILWTPFTGRINVKDFGAKGDNATNDAPAFQLALNAALALGGGEVFVPPGKYKIATAVTLSAASTNIIWSGVSGRSQIKIATGSAVTSFAFSNIAETLTIRDLTFVGWDQLANNDCANIIRFDTCETVIMDNVRFYGIANINTADLMVASATNLTMKDCGFLGCAANSGIATSAINNTNWKGIKIINTIFKDFGVLDGVFYSKTPLAVALAWISINDPNSMNYNMLEQSRALVRDCRFDEGAIRGVSAQTNPASTGKYINTLNIEGCAFNVSNVTGSAVLSRFVRNLTIDNCAFGWATSVQGNMIYVTDCPNLVLKNCDYDTNFSGQIYHDTDTIIATQLRVDNSRFLQINNVSQAMLVDFKLGTQTRRILTAASAVTSYATISTFGTGGSYIENKTNSIVSNGFAQALSTVKTGTYTITTDDGTVLGNSTAGTFVVNLPAANAFPAGRQVEVVNIGSANQITLTRAGADTIQDAATNATTYAVTTALPRATLRTDGTSIWYVVAK